MTMCLPIARSVIAVQLQVQVEETFAFTAIHFVQTFAHSGLLVEHRPVQTQELDVCYFRCKTNEQIIMTGCTTWRVRLITRIIITIGSVNRVVLSFETTYKSLRSKNDNIFFFNTVEILSYIYACNIFSGLDVQSSWTIFIVHINYDKNNNILTSFRISV